MKTRIRVVAAALLLAGCSTVVTPSPEPTLGVCRPTQVRLTPGSSGAAAGSSILTFTATLVEAPACLVLTWPTVTITDGSGAVVVSAPADLAALPRSTLLAQSLEFHLGWASSCGRLPAGPYTARIELIDRGGVGLSLPADFGPSGCMGAPMSVWVEPGWDR